MDLLVCGFYNPFSLRALAYRLLCVFSKHRRRYGNSYYRGPTYAAFRRNLTEQGLEFVQETGLGWFPTK